MAKDGNGNVKIVVPALNKQFSPEEISAQARLDMKPPPGRAAASLVRALLLTSRPEADSSPPVLAICRCSASSLMMPASSSATRSTRPSSPCLVRLAAPAVTTLHPLPTALLSQSFSCAAAAGRVSLYAGPLAASAQFASATSFREHNAHDPEGDCL